MQGPDPGLLFTAVIYYKGSILRGAEKLMAKAKRMDHGPVACFQYMNSVLLGRVFMNCK